VLFADPLKISKILVVTSAFHLPRTREAFDWIYRLRPPNQEYNLSFESVPDQGLDQTALNARKDREAKSLETLIMTRQQISTLLELAAWLYLEHGAYKPGRQPDQLSDAELKSY
jgi:hypothetical protein